MTSDDQRTSAACQLGLHTACSLDARDCACTECGHGGER